MKITLLFHENFILLRQRWGLWALELCFQSISNYYHYPFFNIMHGTSHSCASCQYLAFHMFQDSLLTFTYCPANKLRILGRLSLYCSIPNRWWKWAWACTCWICRGGDADSSYLWGCFCLSTSRFNSCCTVCLYLFLYLEVHIHHSVNNYITLLRKL